MSQFDAQKYHRRSIRLKGYDYSQPGAYFVTIVTHQRETLFGEIVNGEMRLNPLGKLVKKCWLTISIHFPQARLDEFVIMPNHLHGIIFLSMGEASADNALTLLKYPMQADASPLPPMGTKPQSLGAIIQNFKSISTRLTNSLYFNSGSKLWQRNYYEHIVRDERELSRIRQYICNNPLQWETDQENPFHYQE
jgi:putative transposase